MNIEIVDEAQNTGEVETPLDAFRRSAGFQIMFVLHSGLEVGKAIDHLCASAEKMSAALREWQPIESAPHDGTRLLLVRGDYIWLDEWWKGDGANANWSHLVAWKQATGKTPDPPTHWMPLPEPPSLTPKE